MAVPFVNDKIIDQGLNYLKANCTRVVACSAEPASFAEATTTLGTGTGKRIAQATVAAVNFTIGSGTGGVQRKCSFGGIDVSGAGLATSNPTVLAWLDVTNSEILALTDENGTVTIGAGSDVGFPAVDVVQLTTPISA